ALLRTGTDAEPPGRRLHPRRLRLHRRRGRAGPRGRPRRALLVSEPADRRQRVGPPPRRGALLARRNRRRAPVRPPRRRLEGAPPHPAHTLGDGLQPRLVRRRGVRARRGAAPRLHRRRTPVRRARPRPRRLQPARARGTGDGRAARPRGCQRRLRPADQPDRVRLRVQLVEPGGRSPPALGADPALRPPFREGRRFGKAAVSGRPPFRGGSVDWADGTASAVPPPVPAPPAMRLFAAFPLLLLVLAAGCGTPRPVTGGVGSSSRTPAPEMADVTVGETFSMERGSS